MNNTKITHPIIAQTMFTVVVICLFLPVILSAQALNLVKNSGFENDTAGSLPTGYDYWQTPGEPGVLAIDGSVGFQSQKSAKIAGASSACYWYSVDVLPGEKYRVESLCRQSGIGTAIMKLYWKDANNNWNWDAGITTVSYYPFQAEWKKAVVDIEVPSGEVVQMAVMLMVSGQTSTADVVWFDNISVMGENLIENGKFENDIPGSLPAGYEYWQAAGGTGVFAVDGSVGYKSQKSAKISGSSSACYWYTINVLPGETYKVESLCRQSGTGTASMKIYWKDANNNWNWDAGITTASYQSYDGDWNKAVADVQVPTENVAQLSVLLTVEGQTSASDTVWFDAVCLIKTVPSAVSPEVPANLVAVPSLPLDPYNLNLSQNEILSTLRMGILPYTNATPATNRISITTQAEAESLILEMREAGYNAILTEGQRYLFVDDPDHPPFPGVLYGSLPLSDNINTTKLVVDACHKYGLKAYLHLTMSAVSETFPIDYPTWMTASIIDGQLTSIWGFYWACVNNSDFTSAYYQRLDSLIQGTGADGLMVDEACTMADLCGCSWCRAKFTNDTGSVMPPTGTAWLGDLQSQIYRTFLPWRVENAVQVNQHIKQILRTHQPDGILLSYYACPYSKTCWADHGCAVDMLSKFADTKGWEIIQANILGHWPLIVANLKLVRAAAESDLIENGKFENDTPGSLPAGYEYWQAAGGTGVFAVDGSVGYKSQKSAKISGSSSACYWYTINVLPGETYKVESLCRQSGTGTAIMKIYWKDANNNWNWDAGITTASYQSYDGDWNKAVADVQVPTENVAQLSVMLTVEGQTSASDTVWFDNINIKGGAGSNVFMINSAMETMDVYPDTFYYWLIALSQGAHQYWVPVAPAKSVFMTKLTQWERRHENFLAGLRSCADTAVLLSTRSNNLIANPSGYIKQQNSFFAICNMLSLAHIPYKAILDGDIQSGGLGGAKTIIIMNTGLISDADAATLRQFVQNGGTLICSAETSLYDGNGTIRANFALADVFGCNYNGTIKDGGTLVIDTGYPLLDNLCGNFNQPDESCAVTPTTATVLGYQHNVGDVVVPALLLNNFGSGKVFYFTGHPETTLYMSRLDGNQVISRSESGYGTRDLDMAQLFCNIITNAGSNDIMVENLPPGVVAETYSHTYKGANGIQVHLANLTGGTIAGGQPPYNNQITFPDVVLPDPANPIKIHVRNKVINNAYILSPDFDGLYEIPLEYENNEVICNLSSFIGRYLIIYFNQGDTNALQNLAKIPVCTGSPVIVY